MIVFINLYAIPMKQIEDADRFARTMLNIRWKCYVQFRGRGAVTTLYGVPSTEITSKPKTDGYFYQLQ